MVHDPYAKPGLDHRKALHPVTTCACVWCHGRRVGRVPGVTDREPPPRWASSKFGKALVGALRKLGFTEDEEEWPR